MINKKYKFNKQILNESLKVDEIFVYLDEKDESAILQNELFKLGFLWCDGSNDVFHPENFFDEEEEEMIICISLKDKDLSYISSIEEFREHNSNDVRLYSFSDLEQIIDIISGKPNYKSKQKPSRILEKYFHENYKYTTIPFKIETVSELNKIKLFLNNNKELFINLNFNIDETFTYITNIYLYKHINIIIEFMINMDNKLIFVWDQYDDFVSYVDKNSYEKIYNIDDLQNNIINNIIKYGNPYPRPTYKPKDRIVRESNNGDFKIIIKIDNNEQGKIVQEKLFQLGFIWILSSSNFKFFNFHRPYVVIYANLSNNQLTYCDNINNSYINRVNNKSFDYIYPKVFNFNELDLYLNLVKNNGVEEPSYKPKQKPIRESILPYEKAVIYVGNDYENTIIQETLFKNGFYWVEHGNNIQYQITPFLLVTYFNNKIIRYSNNRQSIEQAKKGLYPDAYPKLYYFESLGEYISLLKNKGIVPNYKSKQKPIRENILIESVKLHYKYPYKKIIITINNIEESNEFLEYFKNIPQFVNIYDNIIDLLKYANENKEFPIYISFYKNSNEKILYGWDNLKHLERYNDIDSYGKIFTVNDIKNDFITNILRHGDVNPNYNPKSKTIRETKLNEEVADNIHLSDDVVLNYYDDDAYAFLFYNGYPKGQFIIEQGLTHKNMMGNYLYNLKDEEYMKVYYTQQNDDYLYDRVEESEYKGRLWINNKVISFWDLSYTKQDVTALKNILKIIENKLNIEINNDWLIEFFDIEKQRLFLITLDKYFKGELDEDDSKKMSTSYYEYLKQQHLNTKIKKPVPYGYGSKNPKYKSLQYRQTLYQESLNNDTINIKNIPDVSRELNVQQQRKIFKKGDTVYIRPDAKNYFTDIDESAEKFIGKTAIIKGVYTIKHIYSKKSLDKYYISDIDINNIIPKNINYRKNDIVVFVANDDIDDEYDYAFFYRCLYNESLSEPNYNKKNKIIRESNNINFLKNDQYDSFCFKIDDNMQEIKKYLNDLNINPNIINDNWESKEYVFFTKRLNSNYDKFIVYKCNYEYFIENSFSRDLGLKISPLFSFDELKNYISKYIKPSYQPKNKIDRTFESNKWYPYRFKTEQEFIKEFGHRWIYEVGWNDDNQMDYLFGQPYPFNVNEDDYLPFIEDNHNGYHDIWSINWNMLTKNEPKIPTYKSKNKITRTFESNNPNKNYPYRFKTEQEFIDEFGDDWMNEIKYGWTEDGSMDYLFGTDYPYNVNEGEKLKNLYNDREYDFLISWDMLTKNKPTTPSYKSKNKITRTFESNKWYPYRFKTEQEFIDEFGYRWIDLVSWNDDNNMDYLFGQSYPFNIDENDKILPPISNTNNRDNREYWYVTWNMLTKNEPKKPTYQSKSKINRLLESKTWYPYRFKTEQEFIHEFGDNWSNLVQYSWCNNMNYLFGQLYPFDVTKETQRLNNVGGWSISWDMLTKNKPTTPSYEPKNKIVRENLITEDCDFVILPNGEKLKYTDFDAIPFMYINNKLLIGNNGSIHYNMVYDYILSINGKTDDSYELYNNSLKGRLWLNSKVISFWDYIKKDDLVKVISDIKEKLNINIDNTWLLDYYQNEEFDDKLGKNLIPINDYLKGDYKDNTNDIEYQKKKKQHIDTTFKHYVPSGYGSKSSKYKPLEYRQLLYQESNNIVNPKIITKFAENDIIMERINAKKMEIPGDVLLFYHLFKTKGYKLYLVGGCVRDYLMGIKPHDFDMVTDAQPNEVTEILKNFRTDIHGVHFGVVRVYTESEPSGYEIATYRKDISKGRNTKGDDPKVEIGKHITIKDDVLRRDLTINALFYDIGTGEIVDIVGGRRDIENKIVRAVGEPSERFKEDRLRILRTIRFSAITGSKIDDKTSNAIRQDNRLFGISEEDDVSRERIFAEFLKVKEKTRSNDDPSILTRFINLLIEYDIMSQIFPVLVTEKDIVPTKYLTVALAQTLKSNVINNKFKETLKDAKIPTDYIDIISVLIKILKKGVDIDNVYLLYREMMSKGVRTDILADWIRVMRINDMNVKALLYYKPSTTGQDVMKDGFKKAEIGEEIKRRESIKFKKLVNDLKN